MRGSRVPDETREKIRKELKKKSVRKTAKDHYLSETTVRRIREEK